MHFNGILIINNINLKIEEKDDEKLRLPTDYETKFLAAGLLVIAYCKNQK